MLDVYERAISALKKLVEALPGDSLTVLFNPDTADENCRSVQTILTHVVNSGYGYATSIHNINSIGALLHHECRRDNRSQMSRNNLGRGQFADVDIVVYRGHESRAHQQHRSKRGIDAGIQKAQIEEGEKVRRRGHGACGAFVRLRVREFRL